MTRTIIGGSSQYCPVHSKFTHFVVLVIKDDTGKEIFSKECEKCEKERKRSEPDEDDD